MQKHNSCMLVALGGIPLEEDAQGLLLALHRVITPESAQGPYQMLGIKLSVAIYKANTLHTMLWYYCFLIIIQKQHRKTLQNLHRTFLISSGHISKTITNIHTNVNAKHGLAQTEVICGLASTFLFYNTIYPIILEKNESARMHIFQVCYVALEIPGSMKQRPLAIILLN